MLSTGPARVDPDADVAPYLPRDQVQLVCGPLHHSAPFTYALRGLMTGAAPDPFAGVAVAPGLPQGSVSLLEGGTESVVHRGAGHAPA